MLRDRKQLVLRSTTDSIYGPYEKKIVMERGNGIERSCSQGGLMKAPDGSWWYTHQLIQNIDSPFQGRPQCLQPVTWTDGDRSRKPVSYQHPYRSVGVGSSRSARWSAAAVHRRSDGGGLGASGTVVLGAGAASSPLSDDEQLSAKTPSTAHQNQTCRRDTESPSSDQWYRR